MACGESLECLTRMDCKLEAIYSSLDDIKLLLARSDPGYRNDTWQTWARVKKGVSTWYEQILTFAGSTMTVQLDLPAAQQLNQVTMIFNDGTSKDYQVRVYTNPADGFYELIDSATSDTNTDIESCLLKEKLPINSRVEVYFANYTVGKRCKITIQADDI